MIENGAITPVIIISFVVSAVALMMAIAGLFVPKKRFSLAAQVALPLALIALVGTFATYRFRNAGQWLPPLPNEVGNWKATDTPMSKETLSILGYPMARGYEYTNKFGEVVYSTLVCAGPFENYHDPTVCVASNGFALTAKQTLPMDLQNWKVRAMIFKQPRPEGDLRIMMYYWTQTRKGETATAARMGNFRDMGARLQTGYSSVVKGDQNVILRIYTIVMPDDQNGVQAQRNLNEVCRATYTTLLNDGTKR
ncbi:MAG: exosortase-associated EpsI family protein [Armatimonadetes bacterium]|nr:exosortase-associated EpsI family protein [Armatimonadota bacterium]